MIATAPEVTPGAPDTHLHAADAAGALALGYLCYVSACWRGDERAPVFCTRLGAYWRPDMPPPPLGRPDAVSPHGGGGLGIHWHQTDDSVLGYVPGEQGGYHVPMAAIPRLVRCAGTTPARDSSDLVL